MDKAKRCLHVNSPFRCLSRCQQSISQRMTEVTRRPQCAIMAVPTSAHAGFQIVLTQKPLPFAACELDPRSEGIMTRCLGLRRHTPIPRGCPEPPAITQRLASPRTHRKAFGKHIVAELPCIASIDFDLTFVILAEIGRFSVVTATMHFQPVQFGNQRSNVSWLKKKFSNIKPRASLTP